jgi:repressor LexA
LVYTNERREDKVLIKMVDQQEIGKQVYEWRKRVGYSIRRASEEAGISRKHYTMIEEGLVRPSLKTLLKIAKALFVPEEEVFRLLGIPYERPKEEALSTKATSSSLIPVIAVVPCGKFIEVDEEPLGYIPRHQDEAPGVEFAVRAEGDSMYPAIWEGDFLLIRRQDTATDGDFVLVAIETDGGWESAVKRFRIKGNKIVLESLNPAYPNIEIKPPMRMRIIGKVVEIKRFLR